MNILIVLSYAPFPVRKGIDRLVVNLMEGLAERHAVFLATMHLDREQGEQLRRIERRGISIRSILAPNKRSGVHRVYYKVKNLFQSAVTGIPPSVLYASPPSYIDLIERTVHDERVNLVLVIYWQLFDLLGRLQNVPVALATMDLDYLVHLERLKRVRSPIRRLLSRIDCRMRERIEWAAYRRYNTILTVTDADAEHLRSEPALAGKTVRTLPLAIDLGRYDPARFTRRAERVLMLGSFDSDFNRDALSFFLREVLPLVLERRPDILLEVVGLGADRILGRETYRNVRCVGVVDDIRPYLGECSLMVLPLRFGGGVRIRMMEAAAMATPVVSTPQGVAGMGLEAGRDLLEVQTPAEMAAAIIRLVEDATAAREIGRNARRWAEERISMTTYPDRLDALLADVVRV